MGITQGFLHKEYKQKFGEETVESWKTREGKPPEGESWKDLETRVLEALKKHKTKHSHKNVVIVSHGGPVRVLRRSIKNLSHEEMGQIAMAKNAEVIELTISREKCKNCGSDFLEENNDVFDTWFSSGQWPFAALLSQVGSKSTIKNQKSKLRRKNIFDWTTQDFEEFYPTTVMETGHDILFFWVARMIMLGLYATGEIPFKYVYLHGLVRDKDRQKMSKSRGNVIDPLRIVDLYGADALRMALVVGNTAGQDIVISEEKIQGYRNFANKIWNASRFVIQNGNFQFPISNFQTNSKSQIINHKQIQNSKFKIQNLTKNDKKNLKELQNFVQEITKLMDSFKFYTAAEKLYHYFWHTFADKIIEESKPRLRSENEKDRSAAQYILCQNLTTLLKLLHPFMPFITEKIWSLLPNNIKTQKLLITESWPPK